jgi:hypothetical protein
MTKMLFVEHQDMIEAVPADRTNNPFRVTILPWRRAEVGLSRMPIAAMRRMKISP